MGNTGFFTQFLQSIQTGISSQTFVMILVCGYIGFLIAGILAIYDRRVMGDFVRVLLAKDATTPEKALTLTELGYAGKRTVISGLRGRGIFVGTVYEAGEKVEFDRENHALPIFRERFDPATARFYIPKPLSYRAAVRFEKKGMHIMAWAVGALVLGVLLLAAILFRERIATEVYDFLRMMLKM